MAEQAIRWKDSRGILHETEEAADHATEQYRRGELRKAAFAQVRSLLEKEMPFYHLELIGRGERRILVNWIIDNWPAIKAIGFAYRLDDLAPPAKGE